MNDLQNLKKKAAALRKEIKERGIGLMSPRKPNQSSSADTDGWAVEIGRLKNPGLVVELWLDRWIGPGPRSFGVCFYAPKPQNVKRLAGLMPSGLQAQATFTDAHWEEVKKVQRLVEPLRNDQLNKSLIELYDKTKSYFFSRYYKAKGSTKASVAFDVSRAATFVEQTVRAYHKASRMEKPVADDVPAIQLDQECRKAVENRAMAVAEAELLKRGYAISNSAGNNPFDFYATKGKKIIYVEVKGTTLAEAKSIILTSTEVLWQIEKHPHNALMLVSGIVLDKQSKPPVASGGKLKVIQPWRLDSERLRETQFVYRL